MWSRPRKRHVLHKLLRSAQRQRKRAELHPGCRPLDPLYAERWQTTEVGKRGGLEVRPPFVPHVDIEPAQYFDAFNAWFKLYGDSATTEHLKPAASHAKKAEILRQVRAL